MNKSVLRALCVCVQLFIIASVFVACDDAEKFSGNSTGPSGVLQSRVDDQDHLQLALGIPVARADSQDFDLTSLYGYSSCRPVAFDHLIDFEVVPEQRIKFSHDDIAGEARIFKNERNEVFAQINGGDTLFAGRANGNQIQIGMILPLNGAQFGAESLEDVLGTWTVSASPDFPAVREYSAAGPDIGRTPFDFTLKGLVTKEITAVHRPDIIDEVTEQAYSAGAVFQVQLSMLPAGMESTYLFAESRPIAYKAEIFANGGDVVHTMWGQAPALAGDQARLTIDWDGFVAGGQRAAGDTAYGVRLTSMLDEARAAEPKEAWGCVWSVGHGPVGVDPKREGDLQVSPDPYIPYTQEELEVAYDEDGNPVWPDDDGDGNPDRFPDHDGDGIPDFEAWDSPPPLEITAFPGSSSSTDWTLRVYDDEGNEIEGSWEGPTPGPPWMGQGVVDISWLPPSDLTTGELKFVLTITDCRQPPDLQILARNEPCQTLTEEVTITYGEKKGLLQIEDEESGMLLATSDPVPYVGGSDFLLASLDVALAPPMILLSSSNDAILMKRRNQPQRFKVRYLVKNVDAQGKDDVPVTISSSVSNPSGFDVTLQKGSTGLTHTEFSAVMTLSDHGSSGGNSLKIDSVSGPTFSTVDNTSGKVRPGANAETDYWNGDAQDADEWRRYEPGRELGFSGNLTPREKSSDKYRKEKIPPVKEAVIAGGYEDLVVTHKKDRALKAWTRVKNQAKSLYVSSHGYPDGRFLVGDGYFAPTDLGEHWKDDIDLGIFALCSVLNIGNFNEWSQYRGEHGAEWHARMNPGAVLLGYNAIAPAADLNLGGVYADTRILMRYRDNLSKLSYPDDDEQKAMSWLLSNASMEVRLADDACAVTERYYYFIHTVPTTVAGGQIAEAKKQNDLGVRSTNRAIWRLHRSQWGRRGWKSFQEAPKGPLGASLMRALPDAGPGESERI